MVVSIFAGILAILSTGIPVGIGLAIVGLATGYLVLGPSSLALLPASLFSATSSFLLVAIPLFILMSEIMRRGGITEIIFETVTKWLGHLPGGLAVSAVVTSAIGASITGSSVANAASMAIVAVPPMLQRGYNPRFTYGLIAASGTLGIMIPPSIPMLLYGAITEESVGKLFIAGIIPGLFIAFMLIVYAVIVCGFGRVYQPLPKASAAERWRQTRKALWALALPIVVIGGIYSGIVTPTEAAAVGVTYSLFISIVIYRTLDWERLKQAFMDSCQTTCMILFIITGALVLGNVMTTLQISQSMLSFVVGLKLEPWMFVVAVMILLLLLGCILEVISIIYILVPLLHPIVLSLGLDPIWFCVIFVLNMEIALVTPPVGMVLYVMTGILRTSVAEVIHGSLPFLFVLLAALGILIVFPELSLFLTRF